MHEKMYKNGIWYYYDSAEYKWKEIKPKKEYNNMRNDSISITLGSYELRAANGNLSQQEIKDLYNEVLLLRRDNSTLLRFIRLIAGSNSQWKDKAQTELDKIEFGTSDPNVIAAAKKAIEYRNKVKG